MDDLLKEVAETPVPPDAPLPPEEEEPEDQSPDFDEDHLLPSQRSGGKRGGIITIDMDIDNHYVQIIPLHRVGLCMYLLTKVCLFSVLLPRMFC